MVRFVRINRVELLDGKVDVEALKSAPLLFFTYVSPQLEQNLRERGISMYAIPPEGVPDGSLVLVGDKPMEELAYVSDRLLGPGGCPWDQAQTHETLKRYLLEEAYEVLDAIDSGSSEKLEEELGDLLLQPIMHAQMKKAAGEFDIDDVAGGIVDKLIRRHPHVFGEVDVADADEVLRNWDEIKRKEKGSEPQSILAGVPKGMASLLRAYEVSKRARRVGFEWPDIDAVFDKLREEEAELRQAIASGDAEHIESEIGDVLFTVVNLARWSGVEPEEALRKMLNRFTGRFQYMEAHSAKPLIELTAEEWDGLWREAKGLE
jgi:MazG family protein